MVVVRPSTLGARACLAVAAAAAVALTACGRLDYGAVPSDAGVGERDAGLDASRDGGPDLDPLEGGPDAAPDSDAGREVDGGPPDRDGDGFPDAIDLCPDDGSSTQHDEDGDSVGDVCDVCPHLVDPTQADGDADGVGDDCDPDPASPGNAILAFLSFEGSTIPSGWTAEIEAGTPWTISGDDLVVATSGDDVALFTMSPTPSGMHARVDTAFTVDSISPFVSGYQYRTIAIVDDVAGTTSSDDSTWIGIIQNADTLADASLDLLTLRAGRTMTTVQSASLGAQLTAGTRYPLHYVRELDQRSGTLALPSPLAVAGAIPVVGGGIGVRVRGLAVRFHHLVVIR